MQRALPYRTWLPATGISAGGQSPATEKTSSNGDIEDGSINVKKLVSENAVMVFGGRGCCMCHVVKLLLLGHGVNPNILEVDEAAVTEELSRIMGGVEEGNDGRPKFPVVFIGGKLFGGLEKIMATHISGELVPMLREAGALWL
ncbi:glutaredoxin-C9-like [Cornus florida]|uniref:glutaredoxin-C9-like n=1 Tax=Cornus florida TaxID=4283 RepID=UPI00289C34C2|nr:glutaredoxin-C9-like [Cornus florida]